MSQALRNIKSALPAFEKKGASQGQLPQSYKVDGKTYYSLTTGDLDKFYHALNCSYTDYNLVQLAGSIGEIFAPIHAIASRVANAKYELRKLKDHSVVTDNVYMNKLLQQPNPLQNWSQFIYESVFWQYINGNNYIYANVADTLSINYKNISTLQNLWSYMVEAVHEPKIKMLSATKIEDIIKAYRLSDGSAEILPQKILFNQFMSREYSDRKIRGKSPLLSAQKAIANIMAVYDARGAIYLNHGALGLLVSKAQDQGGTIPLTPDEKQQVRDDYQADYGITGGRSPIAITSMPMEWIQIAMSIAELMPFDETRADAAVIYGVLEVPELLMPTVKDGTFENQNMAERSLYQNVATPLAVSRAQAITTYLKLNDGGFYLHASHDHIEVLQENRKEKAETNKIENETYALQYRSGVITMNDWIKKTGGEPVMLPIYEKRTLDMTPDELAIIMPLLNIRLGTSNSEGAQKN